MFNYILLLLLYTISLLHCRFSSCLLHYLSPLKFSYLIIIKVQMPKNVEAPLSRYLIKSSVHMPINVIILLLRYLIKSKVHMPMNDTAILSHFVIIKVHMPMNVIIFLPIYLISDIMNSLQFLICIFLCRWKQSAGSLRNLHTRLLSSLVTAPDSTLK